MRLIKDTVKLSNKIITSKSLSHNAVLAYTGLRMLMLRDSYVRSGLSYDICTSSGAIAYELGIQEPDKYMFDAIKQGLMELSEKEIIKSTPCVNDYIIDTYNLCLDIKEPYVKVDTASINLLMDLDEQGRKKIPLLRYFLALISTFNHSDYMGEMSGKVGGMSIDYIAKQACINNQMTCIRYNETLEKLHLIYVYRSNDKIKFDNSLKQINNCYSRYKDKDLCIKFATDYENLYGHAHSVIKTKKQKKEADNNRRYAAYYNQICMGTEYPIEIVRQVKKYIHNKNTYLQSEIDNKYTSKRITPLSYSERKYVEKLKSQLRDEAPIDKLLESLESKENQWGEPDPLDESDNLSEEIV